MEIARFIMTGVVLLVASARTWPPKAVMASIFSSSPMVGTEYRVDDLLVPTTYDAYYPQVAANQAGTVVHVWLEAIFGSPTSHRIHCKTSFDHGQTITTSPSRVDSTPAPFGVLRSPHRHRQQRQRLRDLALRPSPVKSSSGSADQRIMA